MTESTAYTWLATAVVRIRGTHGAWQAVSEEVTEWPLVRVQLTITGKPESGFHLVMDPQGFFIADDWYVTKEEAVLTAEETFGVNEADWVEGTGERQA